MDIKFVNVSKRFGEKEVLNNFNCIFKEKEINLVLGASGSGKTTILNMILGLCAPDSGEIVIDKSERITAVFQEERLLENQTVESNINLPLSEKLSGEKLEYFFESLNLKTTAKKTVSELSGGMKRRVSIIRAIAPKPDILVLDEAFAGLDKETIEKALQFVIRENEGKTIIATTHNEELFENVAHNKIYV